MPSPIVWNRQKLKSLAALMGVGILMVIGVVMVYSLDTQKQTLIQEQFQLQEQNHRLVQELEAEKNKNTELQNQFSQLTATDSATTSAAIVPESIATPSAKKISPSPSPSPSPATAPEITTAAIGSSGYTRQSVTSEAGAFTVSYVAADLATTKVIVDTASGQDCANDCPVLPLADYVSRNGAFAGINGSYFCPASYPTCAGKTNSFDLLVMNKDKTYFNSANNVYSTNPAVIFAGGSVRFVGQTLEWGRDTGIDSMLSNYPLLLQNSEVRFGGDGDPKKTSRGPRGFVANKGNTVYIGVVSGATVAEAAHVLKAMGLENGMNLDSGGSTALWADGYKAGPGRNIPNAILFVRK